MSCASQNRNKGDVASNRKYCNFKYKVEWNMKDKYLTGRYSIKVKRGHCALAARSILLLIKFKVKDLTFFGICQDHFADAKCPQHRKRFPNFI